MSNVANHPWHLLVDAGDFFDVTTYGHKGKARGTAMGKIRAAAKRRCPNITVELLPQTEPGPATVRVTRNTSPR